MLVKRRRHVIYSLSLIIFFISVISFLISRNDPRFAQMYSTKIGSVFRLIPLAVSNLIDVSLFEILIYTSPLWLFGLVFYAISSYSDKEKRKYKRQKLLAILLLSVSLYLSTIGVSYYKTPKSLRESPDNVSLAVELISDRLYETEAEYLSDASLLGEALAEAYYSFSTEELDVLPIFPKIKYAKSEYLLCSMGILGAYSFLSSEVIINPAAPDYTKPFSAAHEIAHLYGIAREDEASLYAFCALYSSGSEALRYSACLCALDYLLPSLYAHDAEKYKAAVLSLPEGVRYDLNIGVSFSSLSDGALGAISSEVNDAVISIFDSDGQGSYSRFSYLVADYLVGGDEVAS